MNAKRWAWCRVLASAALTWTALGASGCAAPEGTGPAAEPPAATGDLCDPTQESCRKFEFVNGCSETIWVGALGSMSKCTSDADCLPGGGGCDTGFGACQCATDSDCWPGQVCPSANYLCWWSTPNGGGWELTAGSSDSVLMPPEWSGRFWPRTGCTGSGSDFSCETGDCTAEQCPPMVGGTPPTTLAELTLAPPPAADIYDVSLVDGFNAPVQIVPLAGTFVSADGLYACGTPGCTSTTCDPSFQLAPCGWGLATGCGVSELTFVSVPAGVTPPSCSSDGDCTGPEVCGVTPLSTASMACGTPAGCVSPNLACTWVNNLGGLLDCQGQVPDQGTKANLYGCTAPNGESCYASKATGECCGCPSWTSTYHSPEPCVSSNPEWTQSAEPLVGVLKNTCPTAYSFPYDDPTSTFNCTGTSTANVGYTITFCPKGSSTGALSPR